MEFDIRIGTLLDTSKAEEQLQSFISKYGEENDFKINLKISGDEKLEGIEKSLTNIKNLAKSIGNIKMDFDGGGVNVDTAFNKTIEKAKKEIRDFSKEFGNQASNGVEDSVKNISKNLDKEIDNTKKKIESMVKNLENLKLNPFADSNEIDSMIASLKEMGSMSFEDFPNLKLMAIKEEIENITKAYSDLQTTAKNKQLDDIFQTTKVEPLRQQILALKEVMDFKNLDTSGLDKLLDDLKKTSELKDLKQAKAVLSDIKTGFANIQGTTDISKSVKTYETAIQELLKYRRELEEKVRMEIDTSKIQQAEADIKRIDEAIDRLKINSDESIVKNLFDMSELKNMENMEKASKTLKSNMEKLEGAFDKLKGKASQLGQSEFIDTVALEMLESAIKEVGNAFKSLDFNNLRGLDVSIMKGNLEDLERLINGIRDAVNKTELQFDFDNDFSKAEKQLNGFHSALIKLNRETSGMSDLSKKLKDIEELSKVNLEKASNDLKSFIDSLNRLGREGNLGNISGDMGQFTKYVNDIVSSMKKLATTKDVNFGNVIKEEINQTMRAMKQLYNTFDDAEKNFAGKMFKDAQLGLSDRFKQEIEKIDTQVTKLKSQLGQLDIDMDFSSATGGLAEEIERAVNQVKILDNTLDSLDMNKAGAEDIHELRQELERAKESVEELQKTKIDLDMGNVTSQIEELRRELERVGESTEGLDELQSKILAVNNAFRDGVTSYKQASDTLEKYSDKLKEVSKVDIQDSFDMFDSMGKGIQGTFQNITQAFSRFTIGELIEEGIENLASSVIETISGLDASMTELKRVSDDIDFGGDGYKQLANDAREVAISVGQSVEDVITGMATAYQAGATNIRQATEIARTSAILQNVSDMGAEEASQAIASLVNQYYSMDTALSKVQGGVKGAPSDYNNLTNAIDQVNYAGNNFAISSEGVTQALQNGGATLSAYGVTLSDSIAMITAANESMQDPARVGNGLRSIAVNFAGIKANAKTGTLELNKSAKALKEIAGIDIFTDKSKTSVKDMSTLMEELYTKWGTLNEKEQLGLSEALAGKTQSAVFQSLMQNWDRVRQYQNEYKNGFMVGSAERENEIYLDSLAGKWNTLKETMKGLLMNNVSVDFFKGILDGATKTVEAIDKITTSLGKVGTLAVGGGLANLFKNFANFDSFSGLTGLSGNLINFAKSFGSIFSSAFGTMKTSGFTSGIASLTSGFKSLVSGAGLAKTAMIAFNAILNTMAWAVVIGGIALAIKAWDNYAHATENAIKASKEKQQEIQSTMSSLRNEKSSLSEIAVEYDTLASKTNKSAEELQRYKELRQKIAEISPDLVSGYDINGDPIIALNGSLRDYMAGLDEAIAKQQRLYNYETSRQADTYLSENDKNEDNNITNMYGKTKNFIDSFYDRDKQGQVQKWYKDILGLEASSSKEIAEARKRYREEEAKEVQQAYDYLLERRETYQAQDNAIQSKYLTKLSDNQEAMTALSRNNATEMFQAFATELDWGGFNTSQFAEMKGVMNELALVAKSSVNDMGAWANKTKEVNKEFENTGAVQSWGKALGEIASESKMFDMSSWGSYLDEVNKKYEEGSYNAEQYEHALGYMAKAMADITGSDYETVLQSLMGTADLEEVLNSASSGLVNFLDAYDLTIGDLKDNSLAQELEKQFDSLQDFESQFEQQVIEGKVSVDWLLEEAESGDLPKQMSDMIKLVAKDGDVHEVEQSLLMHVEAEIENEGQLTADTIKKIEGLLDGSLNIEEGVTIAGLELSTEEAKILKQELQEAGISAEELKLGETGFEEAVAQAKEVSKALDDLGNKELSLKFSEAGIDDNIAEINSLKSAIEGMPKEKKLEFVAECGSYFNDVKTVEEGINKLPDEKKLKYNIGVKGNAELEAAQAKLKNLPEGIRNMIYNNEVIGLNQLELAEDLVSKFGEKDATALLKINGAEEALEKASTVEEFLQEISSGEWVTELDVTTEEGQRLLDKVRKELEELSGKETKAKVDADTKPAEEKIDKVEKKVEEVEKKEAEVKVDANTKPAEEKIDKVEKKVEETNNKKAEPTIDPKTTSAEEKLNSVEKRLQEMHEKDVETDVTVNGSQAESEMSTLITQKGVLGEPVDTLMTIMVSGREQIQATINEKGQLEVDGQAKTHVYVEGLGQYSIAINDKGQLEVDGVAQTHIQVNNGEQLQIARNEKGQLEVNGQAVTDVKINGLENVKEGEEALKNLPDEKSVSVSFNVNDAIDSILSRLGLNKKQETIEITVKAIDEASSTLDKINGYEGKTVTFTITCNGGSEAAQQIETIANTAITNKTFSITCTGGDTVSNQIETISSTTIANKSFTVTANTDTVSSQLNSIATRTISNKTFQITCNDTASAKLNALVSKTVPTKTVNIVCNDQATSKLNSVVNRSISDKKFTVNCTDDATARIQAVIRKTINNKSFTINCKDNASGVLNSIRAKLNSIRGKTVTVTAKYATSGRKPAGLSVSQPQVVEMGTAIPVTMNLDNNSIASTMSMARTTASAVNSVMASTQASYTDTIWSGAYWVGKSLEYDIDLLKDYTEQLERVSSKLDLVSKRAEDAFGSSKANLIREEISLMEQKQSMLKLEEEKLKRISENAKQLVRNQGFGIDSNGAVYNYTTRMEELERAVKNAKNAQDAYKGEDEARQKSLQDAYDKANKKLEAAKEALDLYYETSKKVTDTEAEWHDMANAIEQAKNEIYEANKEQSNFYKEAQTTELEYQYDKLSDKLDIIQAKMELSNNAGKIDLLQQELDLLEQQRIKNLEIEASYRRQQDYYRNYLSQKGFKFDKEGDITNGAIQLDAHKASDEIESIKDAYEQYMELQRDTIPDLEKEWYDLQLAEQKAREEIENIQKEIEELNKMKVLDNIDELIEKQEDLNREMQKLEIKLDTTYGTNKTNVLKEQIKLLEKQMGAEEDIMSELRNQMRYLQSTMTGSGFSFDFDGNLMNLDSVLSTAQTMEEYEELKDQAEEYLDIQNQITDSEIEWLEYQKSIRETKDEIENLKHEMMELKYDARLTELNNDLGILESRLEKIQSLDNLSGINSIDMLDKQLDIIREQQDATLELINFRKQQAEDLSEKLISYGFTINDDGTIDNTAQKLEVLKNALSEDEFGRVEDYLADYFEAALEEISNLENQLIEYQADYEDILKSKLEATEKIEDEITKILEKQIEDRIEAIEKERDAQVKSLNKQKEAYQRWRDEVDYEDDYGEQLSKVQELQAQIEIAKRDDSLSGQKRVEELMKELKEEQKALEELVQNKIDEDINNMIDDQIDHIETNADKQIENLENTFTETKIAEMVAEAIQTGIFTDIEGNVTALDQALMDFANNSVEYMGVMGESLKTELLDNLNIALSTMAQLNEINKELNGVNYDTSAIAPLVSGDSVSLAELINLQGSSLQGSGVNNVAVGDIVINVQGSVDNNTLADIETLMKQQRNQIINEIMVNVK